LLILFIIPTSAQNCERCFKNR